jgi:phage FluMu gp28-like protein
VKLENRNWKIADGVTNFDSSIANRQSQIANLSVARLVRVFANTPFQEQLSFARELLSLLREDGRPLVRRACIDATGMGAPLAEALTREFGPRVEPVVFTPAVKEDLAFRTKRRMEARLTLLPDTREIRRAFSAVKKIVTPSGNLRFDAERTEAGHADEFWAKALADLAADSRPAASHADAFLADGAPLISPLAFAEVDTRFSIWDF